MGSFFSVIHIEVLLLRSDRAAQGVGALYDLIEVRFIFVFLLAQFREGGLRGHLLFLLEMIQFCKRSRDDFITYIEIKMHIKKP
jgi:hypothetical protein